MKLRLACLMVACAATAGCATTPTVVSELPGFNSLAASPSDRLYMLTSADPSSNKGLQVIATDGKPRELALSPAELLAVYQTCQASTNKPKTLADLNGGYELFQSIYSESSAVSLGIISAGTITGDRKASVWENQFFRYAHRNCTIKGKDVPVVWGAGIRSTIHVSDVKSGAVLTGLPALAASVQLTRAKASMNMRVVGAVGPKVAAALPATQVTFGVETYAAWATASDKIRVLLEDPTTTVTPQLIITEQSIPAITMALRGG